MGPVQKLVLGLAAMHYDVREIAKELERPEREIIRIQTRLIELVKLQENGQPVRTGRQ